MAMDPKDGPSLMSWARHKVDELDLRGRWVGVTNGLEPKVNGWDLMGWT